MKKLWNVYRQSYEQITMNKKWYETAKWAFGSSELTCLCCIVSQSSYDNISKSMYLIEDYWLQPIRNYLVIKRSTYITSYTTGIIIRAPLIICPNN